MNNSGNDSGVADKQSSTTNFNHNDYSSKTRSQSTPSYSHFVTPGQSSIQPNSSTDSEEVASNRSSRVLRTIRKFIPGASSSYSTSTVGELYEENERYNHTRRHVAYEVSDKRLILDDNSSGRHHHWHQHQQSIPPSYPFTEGYHQHNHTQNSAYHTQQPGVFNFHHPSPPNPPTAIVAKAPSDSVSYGFQRRQISGTILMGGLVPSYPYSASSPFQPHPPFPGSNNPVSSPTTSSTPTVDTSFHVHTAKPADVGSSSTTPRQKLRGPPLVVLPRSIGPVYETNENDVLSGRGGRINSHIGNVRFRDIVSARKSEYVSHITKKIDKGYIAAEIVRKIRNMNPPGRFLKEDNNGLWYEIGDQRAIKKVGQALREDAAEVRGDNKDVSNNVSPRKEETTTTSSNANPIQAKRPPSSISTSSSLSGGKPSTTKSKLEVELDCTSLPKRDFLCTDELEQKQTPTLVVGSPSREQPVASNINQSPRRNKTNESMANETSKGNRTNASYVHTSPRINKTHVSTYHTKQKNEPNLNSDSVGQPIRRTQAMIDMMDEVQSHQVLQHAGEDMGHNCVDNFSDEKDQMDISQQTSGTSRSVLSTKPPKPIRVVSGRAGRIITTPLTSANLKSPPGNCQALVDCEVLTDVPILSPPMHTAAANYPPSQRRTKSIFFPFGGHRRRSIHDNSGVDDSTSLNLSQTGSTTTNKSLSSTIRPIQSFTVANKHPESFSGDTTLFGRHFHPPVSVGGDRSDLDSMISGTSAMTAISVLTDAMSTSTTSTNVQQNLHYDHTSAFNDDSEAASFNTSTLSFSNTTEDGFKTPHAPSGLWGYNNKSIPPYRPMTSKSDSDIARIYQVNDDTSWIPRLDPNNQIIEDQENNRPSLDNSDQSHLAAFLDASVPSDMRGDWNSNTFNGNLNLPQLQYFGCGASVASFGHSFASIDHPSTESSVSHSTASELSDNMNALELIGTTSKDPIALHTDEGHLTLNRNDENDRNVEQDTYSCYV